MTLLSLLATAVVTHPAAADTHRVDPVHSSVVFRIKHMNVSYFYGRFTKVGGTFVLEDDPTKNSFNIQVDAASIDTNDKSRDKHLKSPDFLSAKQFPKISFVSKRVTRLGDRSFEVVGDFTLHGVTKELTLTVEHVGSGPGRRGGKLAGIATEFVIKRSDFGMNYGAGALGDEIRLMIGLEGPAE